MSGPVFEKEQNLLDTLRNSLELLSRWKCRGFSCSSESIDILASWNTSSKTKSEFASQFDESASQPQSLDQIQAEAATCSRCPLCSDRLRVLFGQGDVNARLFIIGSMPNPEEDRTGFFFSDQTGELLSKIVGAMKLAPDQVYITNIIKCRPKNGRLPTVEETYACQSYWRRQIQIVNPDVICCLGELATRTLLDEDEPLDVLRGKFVSKFGCRIMPTLSPEYLIEHPEAKRLVWDDVKKIMAYLGIPSH